MQLQAGFGKGTSAHGAYDRVCTVIELAAFGETSTGAASHPCLYRPNTSGSPTSAAPEQVALDPASPVETINIAGINGSQVTQVATTFTAAPSNPVVPSGSYNLPMVLRWVAPPRQGFVVAPGAYVVFYAAASGGHTWTGEMTFKG